MSRSWQSRREPVSHADDWLMTYADMITLLLCFFAIFLFISIRKDVPQKAEIALPMPLPVQPKTPSTAEIEPKGDRITTFEISSAAFFDSGSATLSTPGESILRDMAVDLKSDRFKDYQITVEGHTDDAPISTARFPSNWELSTARASAVVHFFLDQGIPAMKLRAAGYADTFPKVPNRDANGTAIPQNQSQNRRVVIKLERIEKAAMRK